MTIDPKLTTITIKDDIDPVNKPIHYNQAGIECIEAIDMSTRMA
jgi:hypothetical protein